MDTGGIIPWPVDADALRREFKVDGRHKGEMVFIFGNGPSLNLAVPYRDVLSKRVCIGLNYSYRILPAQYLLFYEWLPWGNIQAESPLPDTFFFYPEAYIYGNETPIRLPRPGVPYKFYKPDEFAETFDAGLQTFGSCLIPAINLAYLFGAKQIILIGVDLKDCSHFYPEPTVTDTPHLWPNVDKILACLDGMQDYLAAKGVRCLNCSPNSALTSWKKASLEEFFCRRLVNAKGETLGWEKST